jgi:hypothetical protein
MPLLLVPVREDNPPSSRPAGEGAEARQEVDSSAISPRSYGVSGERVALACAPSDPRRGVGSSACASAPRVDTPPFTSRISLRSGSMGYAGSEWTSAAETRQAFPSLPAAHSGFTDAALRE